jgi:hypothetical protein
MAHSNRGTTSHRTRPKCLVPATPDSNLSAVELTTIQIPPPSVVPVGIALIRRIGQFQKGQ